MNLNYEIEKLIEKSLYKLSDEKDFYEEVEKFLKQFTYEDKLEVVGQLLCREWYLIEDIVHIKKVVNILVESLN